MLKIIAHDTINDVAAIRTAFGYSVRYGLQVQKCRGIRHALEVFSDCQRHALAAIGAQDGEAA